MNCCINPQLDAKNVDCKSVPPAKNVSSFGVLVLADAEHQNFKLFTSLDLLFRMFIWLLPVPVLAPKGRVNEWKNYSRGEAAEAIPHLKISPPSNKW